MNACGPPQSPDAGVNFLIARGNTGQTTETFFPSNIRLAYWGADRCSDTDPRVVGEEGLTKTKRNERSEAGVFGKKRNRSLGRVHTHPSLKRILEIEIRQSRGPDSRRDER